MSTELMSNKTALLSESVRNEIDQWIAKYPADRKQSAVLPVLLLVQEANNGWLTQELMDAVAAYLEMPNIAVYEVASFYSMYELKPVGRHKINICTNISCMLSGANKIVNHLQQRLGIELGQTTADGKFTLKEVECLGACANAPIFHLGHRYYEDLTPEKVDKILEELK